MFIIGGDVHMKKFLGIVCFIYSSLILYIWIKGDLNNYIAPNMQMYIKGSLIPLIIIGIVLVTNIINYWYTNIDNKNLLTDFLKKGVYDETHLSDR